MIITCEGCGRRFQVDDARVPQTGARVRCKRCNHRFHVRPGDGQADDSTASGFETTLGGVTLSGATKPPPEAATKPPPEATTESAPEAVAGARPSRDADPDASETKAPTSDELKFVTEPPAGPGAGTTKPPTEAPSPADEAIGEGSWEFGDSSLTFDDKQKKAALDAPTAEVSQEDAPETPAEAAAASSDEAPAVESSQAFMDAMTEEPEAAASEPEGDEESPFEATPEPAATIPPSEIPEERTLRPIAPVAGGESAIFELDEDESAGEPIELETTDEADGGAEPVSARDQAPASSVPEAPASPVDAEPTAPMPVLDAAAKIEPPDIDAPEGPDPVDAAFDAFDLEDDGEETDPDWPEVGSAAAESGGLPPQILPRPRRRLRLDAIGWLAPAILLFVVLRGGISVAPVAPVPAGEITVDTWSARQVRGRFVENARSGTLFIVSGALVNETGKPAADPVGVRVSLLDAAGRAVAPPATAGPAPPETALRETPVGALVERQARAAAELAESGLAPGARIEFAAVWESLPETAVRFRIEPAGR